MDLNDIIGNFYPPSLEELRHKELMDSINSAQNYLEDIPTVHDTLNEQTKKIVDSNKQEIGKLIDKMIQQNEFLQKIIEKKEVEIEENRKEAIKSAKYNLKMLIIALVSGGIALASLVATILIACL